MCCLCDIPKLTKAATAHADIRDDSEMLQSVVRRGCARRARAAGRSSLAVAEKPKVRALSFDPETARNALVRFHTHVVSDDATFLISSPLPHLVVFSQ